MKDPEIFCLMQLIEDNMGADRISDMTISILQKHFLSYTQRISLELALPTKQYMYSYDLSFNVPFYNGKPILFIPAQFLCDLPYAVDYDDIDREPYMAPALCGEEKADLGKKPNSVWWNSIVGTNSKERNIGVYATKKPLKLFDRIIRASSNVGDMVLDMFAGSGTTGHASEQNGRNSIMIDENQEAINAMKERYTAYELNYKIG